MNKLIQTVAILIAMQFIVACNSGTKSESTKERVNKTEETYMIRHVMTKAEQDSLTPASVLQEFIEGNNVLAP